MKKRPWLKMTLFQIGFAAQGSGERGAHTVCGGTYVG
jgi:hypothetical protein